MERDSKRQLLWEAAGIILYSFGILIMAAVRAPINNIQLSTSYLGLYDMNSGFVPHQIRSVSVVDNPDPSLAKFLWTGGIDLKQSDSTNLLIKLLCTCGKTKECPTAEDTMPDVATISITLLQTPSGPTPPIVIDTLVVYINNGT